MNLNSFYQFPSPFVFHTKVKGHDQIKSTTLHKIIAISDTKLDDPLYKWSPSFSSEMITNYNFKDYSFLTEDIIRNVIVHPLEELKSYLLDNHLDVYHSRVINDLFNDNSEPQLAHMWWNVYKKADYCPVHDHSGCLSGVYILHQDELSPLHFNHTNELGATSYCPSVSEGSVVLFPSSLAHFLCPVQTHRITISFNLVSIPKQQTNEFSTDTEVIVEKPVENS
jgi:hypothetical protein